MVEQHECGCYWVMQDDGSMVLAAHCGDCDGTGKGGVVLKKVPKEEIEKDRSSAYDYLF